MLSIINKGAERESKRGVLARKTRVVAVVTSMAMALTANAFAQQANVVKPAVCTNTISKCGCQIKKNGVYKVTADLSSADGLTPDGDCIEIVSPNAILNLGNFSITGPGGSNSDIGIDVRHSANNDTVVGGAGFSTISGWGTGVYTDSNNGTFSNIDTDSNAFAGIEFDGASGNRLTNWDANHEGTFGLWIRKGSGNFVTQGIADSNRDGIFVGCGDAAGGENCKGAGISRANDIVTNEVNSNARYGLALDSNVAQTVINATTASANGSDDLFDDTSDCGTDTWIDDTFTTSNDVGCID